MGYGIQFSIGDLDLKAFSDTNWAEDPIDWRSTTSYVFFLVLILSIGIPRSSQ